MKHITNIWEDFKRSQRVPDFSESYLRTAVSYTQFQSSVSDVIINDEDAEDILQKPQKKSLGEQ